MYTDQTLEFEKVETSNGTFRDEIILFLKNNGLGIDGDIEQFVVARCQRQLVMAAGRLEADAPASEATLAPRVRELS